MELVRCLAASTCCFNVRELLPVSPILTIMTLTKLVFSIKYSVGEKSLTQFVGVVSIKLATKQKAEEVLMEKRQEIYLGWSSNHLKIKDFTISFYFTFGFHSAVVKGATEKA